jgi:hypothetical protein
MIATPASVESAARLDSTEIVSCGAGAGGPRADAGLDRKAVVPITLSRARGVEGALYVPSTFSSDDGAYDVYVHFHGSPRVVVEGAEAAGLDALVVVMNHAVRSTVYEETYADADAFPTLLERVRRAARAAGLAEPHARRVAIGSWSAGYGAVSSILANRRASGEIDGVLVADGIHATFADESARRPMLTRLAPFVEAARDAEAGDLLFSLTHSSVVPGLFASSTETADALIAAAQVHRVDDEERPRHLDIDAASTGYLKPAKDRELVQRTSAGRGDFHVRGFDGGTPTDHLAQFVQMGATLLPDLAARWSEPKTPAE